MANAQVPSTSMQDFGENDGLRPAPRGMRIIVNNEEGKQTRCVMASVAKCKPLRAKMKTVDDLIRKSGANARKGLKLANQVEKIQSLLQQDDLSPEEVARLYGEIDDCLDKGEAVSDAQSEIDDQVADAIVDVYACALAGAGYEPHEVERYLSLLDIEQYDKVRATLRTGCGYADFTKRG